MITDRTAIAKARGEGFLTGFLTASTLWAALVVAFILGAACG